MRISPMGGDHADHLPAPRHERSTLRRTNTTSEVSLKFRRACHKRAFLEVWNNDTLTESNGSCTCRGRIQRNPLPTGYRLRLKTTRSQHAKPGQGERVRSKLLHSGKI